VKHDVARKPQQPPYDGPFEVICHADKFFIINDNGKHDTVSIDRLKLAYVEQDLTIAHTSPTTPHLQPAPAPVAVPQVQVARKTRSGHHVH